MSRQFQNQLLNFMETGRVKIDTQEKQYDFRYSRQPMIFLDYQNLFKAGLDGFICQNIPRNNLSKWRLRYYPKLMRKMARYIGYTIFIFIYGDIRDVISIGKLVRKSDTSIEVDRMINTMRKYGAEHE